MAVDPPNLALHNPPEGENRVSESDPNQVPRHENDEDDDNGQGKILLLSKNDFPNNIFYALNRHLFTCYFHVFFKKKIF